MFDWWTVGWWFIGVVSGIVAGRIWCLVGGHNGWIRIAEEWRTLAKRS